ncbi:Ubiquitin-60S ribosomal protein L40 [Zea mays]|uniref:Ubiquitin-60S ribosomal protein L40 n=1 Tax=Zea mays TaxID=4577 RepID=A0A1D6L8S4_MAIZE|nr:Ubiquitin-60S ribosomal protein L40 [Zea mays]
MSAAPCADDRATDTSRLESRGGPAPPAATTMRIMARTLRGDRVALDVDGANTVAQLKSMIMAREGVAAGDQRLFFAGRHLDDDGMPVAHYGVRHGSVVFVSLRLRADDASQSQYVLSDSPSISLVRTVSQLLMIDQQPMMRFEDGDGHGHEEAVVKATTTRPPVSRRSLRKILSRLHVDVWTAQHDAKFLDLLQRRTRGCGVGVGDLTADDWSAIRAELNAATGSAFPVEDLQRRLGELRREFDAVSRIKDHPRFTYDARRHVVVAKETEWKRYVLENPDAVAYEGRSTHFGRLRAIFSGSGAETRGRGGPIRRESRAKRCLSKLLRSFGLRCKL